MIGFATSVACYYLTAIIPWEEMPTQILTFTIGVFAASIMILLVSVLCSLSKEKASIFKIFPYYLVVVIACLAAFILSSELYILSFIGALCISSLIEVSLIMYFGILMQRGFFSPAVAFTLSVVSARLGIFVGNGIALGFEINPELAQIATDPVALAFVCLLAKGNTANGIANKLVISTHTVNTHIRHIYDKVGIHKRSELLEYLNMRKDDSKSI